MADIARLRQRVVYLRRQAALYRRFAKRPCNAPLHARFEDLAKRCGEIAANIERGIDAGLYDRR